jgi:hypothetical protein
VKDFSAYIMKQFSKNVCEKNELYSSRIVVYRNRKRNQNGKKCLMNGKVEKSMNSNSTSREINSSEMGRH